jgi:hypothetical protein
LQKQETQNERDLFFAQVTGFVQNNLNTSSISFVTNAFFNAIVHHKQIPVSMKIERMVIVGMRIGINVGIDSVVGVSTCIGFGPRPFAFQ